MRRQLPLPWFTRAETRDEEVAPALPPSAAPLSVPLASTVFVRNGRARRYILRVLPDARVRVTIPRYGSRREAEAFLRTRLTWIADRQSELRDSPRPSRWQPGTAVLWRGASVSLSVDEHTAAGVVTVRCAELAVRAEAGDDYRPALERAMRRVAAQELPVHLLALAARHGLVVAGVSVRNQRSRWGSCSRSGRIALNWRLLQMPETVREYVLLHELMHLREQNHSPRFWALVAAVCPTYQESRAWLKREGLALC